MKSSYLILVSYVVEIEEEYGERGAISRASYSIPDSAERLKMEVLSKKITCVINQEKDEPKQDDKTDNEI